jgi:hypothetical protein
MDVVHPSSSSLPLPLLTSFPYLWLLKGRTSRAKPKPPSIKPQHSPHLAAAPRECPCTNASPPPLPPPRVPRRAPPRGRSRRWPRRRWVLRPSSPRVSSYGLRVAGARGAGIRFGGDLACSVVVVYFIRALFSSGGSLCLWTLICFL